MALEIEVKLLVPDLAPIRSVLCDLQARELGTVLETNHILDSADGSLRRRGSGLRVRVAQPTAGGPAESRLTFKGPILPGSAKRRQEIEVGVDDPRQTLSILSALGYVPILIYAKRRQSFVVDDCRIELDEVPFLGSFIEIEGPDESAIAQVQTRLGLADLAHQRATYVKRLLDYCARTGTDPLGVDFPAG